MERSTKKAWLEGPSDLRTEEVEDVPVKGSSVLVRGLAGAYSLDAITEATETVLDGRGRTTVVVNRARLEIIQFIHGVVEPDFSEEEVIAISEKYGPAWRKIINTIDRLSALDKDAIAEANARFQSRDGGEGRADVGDEARPGSNGSDVPPRVSAGTRDAGGGAG